MADITPKRIDELPAAESIGQNDLFVIEQSSAAKKANANILYDFFAGATGIEIITIGTATSSDIETAYQAGKAIFGKYTSNNTVTIYPLTKRSDATTHFFGGLYKAAGNNTITVRSFQCVNSVWGYAQKIVPDASSATPSALGTASAGSSDDFSRADHVHTMPSASDVGAEPAITEVTNNSTGTVTVALDAGKLYHFTGALTALTITLTAATSPEIAHYHFDFDSGSTAPTLSLPQTVVMPSGFSVEANKHYEIDILNNYGAVMAWAIS